MAEFQPMAPPGGGPGSEGVDQFGDELKPPPGAGNFRVPLRGRAGRHRHTQSSAAVLHRSAYSTGSLGSAIQSEYSRHGKFLPLPPPDSIDEAGESPMGSPHSRGGSRSPKEWQSRGSEILGGFKVGGAAAAAAAPGGPSAASLRLELQRVAEPEPVDDEELAVRERLLNKFAQEVMRSYPPELVAAVCQPETELSASPTHRRPKPEFVLEDLDTSDWIGPDGDEVDAELTQALAGIRESAAASFQASRRSKTKTSGSPSHKAGADLQKESKELEMELISALETEVKGLRSERQRMEVKYARLREKNTTLMDQMRSVKEELESLKSLPAVAEERHRRESIAAGGDGMDEMAAAAAAAAAAEPDAASAKKIASLEHDVQEKALALKSVRKQFVDTLIKQQRAEKINEELRKDLNESAGEVDNLRDLLDARQAELDDKTEELETVRLDADQERQKWEQKRATLVKQYEDKIAALKQQMQEELANAKLQMAQVQANSENMQRQNSADMNAALVKEMGKMLKEAIEKSTKKSTQVETAMNNGSDVAVDTKDMFKCVTCSYINASIRLVCHNCGSKRFADLRNEKERKHIRKQWVNSLVNMYLNMLEEILKTPRGEKVVQGEARHSSRSGEPITPNKIRQAEEKIQRMLEAAATQKGRQKFSEVYPKLESSSMAADGSPASEGRPTPPPKMKRYVRSVVSANKTKQAFEKKSTQHSEVVAAGSLVYAKWYGPEREKYPDWYEAEVAAVEDADSYVIKYQNGTLCSGVPRKDIRARRSHS